ncbi:MAG: transcription elongation factor GreA [Gammaproteobacteria bacterium]|nr:transcription elongation factor GreA [Gammaproteobacteria bacterium]
MDKIPMTLHGAEMLRLELAELKQVKRPAVIKAISEAREHGDLKENAEYHAAREQQSFIEGRIQDIESKLAIVQVIDPTTLAVGDKIVFGATVTLYDTNKDEELVYQIVGDEEADIKEGKISISSPFARALIGKRVDDLAEVKAPGGVRELEIVKVAYI